MVAVRQCSCFALCNYRLNGTFVTKVPNNPIGQGSINHLRRYGVDTQFIVRAEKGSVFISSRPALPCVPHRLCTTGPALLLPMLDIKEFDFDKIFDGAAWFHTTGITPALSDKAAVLTEAALKAAKKRYHHQYWPELPEKLWVRKKQGKWWQSFCQYVDVCNWQWRRCRHHPWFKANIPM